MDANLFRRYFIGPPPVRKYSHGEIRNGAVRSRGPARFCAGQASFVQAVSYDAK